MARTVRADRRALPLNQWPIEDREAWTAAFKPKGLFDDGIDCSKLKGPTRQSYYGAYARWLRFLTIHFPVLLQSPPATRVTKVTIAAWLKTMQELAPLSRWSEVGCLLRALAIICPNAGFEWLRALHRKLDAVAEPLTPAALKARESDWLLAQGIAYMDKADLNREHRPLMGSSAYRDGLTVAFLALHPLRRRSLAALTLSQHIRINETGITIILGDKDVKNGIGFSFELAPKLVPYVRTYLEVHRPRLLQGRNVDAFWVTYQGRAMTAKSFSERFHKASEKIIGEHMIMHAFRHSAGTTWANRDPETAMLVAPLLGHSTLNTAQKHYVAADRKRATSKYQAILRDRRAALEAEMET